MTFAISLDTPVKNKCHGLIFSKTWCRWFTL